MPQNKTKTGQWAKGQSGNPGGRPRLPAGYLEAIREAVPQAIETLVALMADDKASATARVRAAEAILARAYGTPPSMNEVGALVDLLRWEADKQRREDSPDKIDRVLASIGR